MELRYLQGYSPQILEQTQTLIREEKLGIYLQKRYPTAHNYNSEKLLYTYVLEVKNQHLKKAPPLHGVRWDTKLETLYSALGVHKTISRQHGKRLRSKRMIVISALFKNAPLEFLRMIVVHELAHLKESDHNKAFYNLCKHMEPNYGQLELDSRLYLTYRELFGKLY